jgi:energy-coupling factor transporter ATP-binding protein EcfA2
LIKQIVNSSWQGVELQDYEFDPKENKLNCFFQEGRILREISWAGQGLQVWFQIVTHLVRLAATSVLILDEPEINLHPEKQNDMIKVLKEYYKGSIIIATHSVELMNNVHISHIINIQKNKKSPKIKSTDDKLYLESVRSQIGSNFNFIASQFEDVDIVIFTEDTEDYRIISELASAYEISKKSNNIPLHGFSKYKESIIWKDAYKELLGKTVVHSLLLDRDYYPQENLDNITNDLAELGIRVIFTLGKEIENLFLSPQLLYRLIPQKLHEKFISLFDQLFETEYDKCFGRYITLHRQFFKIESGSAIERFSPSFKAIWYDKTNRHKIIAGKTALKMVRGFYRDNCGSNLSTQMLIKELIQLDDQEVASFIRSIYQT